MRILLVALFLGAELLVMIGSVEPGDVFLAALVAGATLALTRFGRPKGRARILAMPRLLAGAVRELVRGCWAMLWILIGSRTWRNVGNVEVPIGDKSELGAAVFGLIASASPGGVLLEIDQEARVMHFNTIDASDPEAEREQLEQLYRRFQRGAVP